VDAVGPSAFEHLCVALLQLEDPEHIWMHVGGSGDGGVDGMGAGTDGKVVGLLQCKWAYGGEKIVVSDAASLRTVRQVVAALIHPDKVPSRDGIEFWSRRYIASLMLKHASVLPIGLSLRIKEKQTKRR
ncbi:MAG: restriction endonuclease, partial [Candidatus Sulfotelmatobacter sp.]